MGFTDFLRSLFGSKPERRRPRGTERRKPERKNPRGGIARTLLRRRQRAKGDPARLQELGLPPATSAEELASVMGLGLGELMWLADPAGHRARVAPHYRLLTRPKRRGGLRVVLAPRPKLKAAQRWILRNVLDRLELSAEAHGFVRGRSIRTNAQPHVGREVIVALDVQDFFHQFSYRRVRSAFERLGYGGPAARLLAHLTTAPVSQMKPVLAREAGVSEAELAAATASGPRRSHPPILPQGAPTSPALSNLLCRSLDRRLAALARRFGASYTRYADDVTFSGGAELRRDLRRFVPIVKRVLADNGLRPAPGKLRFARKGSRQEVTGLVVNRRLNVPAPEVRRLRAILHNCAVRGPAGENREGHGDFRAHLAGRIAHVASVNPERGARLRASFELIRW